MTKLCIEPDPWPAKWLNYLPGNRRTSIFVGLDLGQERNYTARAVLERRWVEATTEQFIVSAGRAVTGYWDYRVIGLDRYELHASYIDIAHWVKDYLDSIVMCCHKHLIMDATGVGSAVRDCFRNLRLKATLVPVTITGSNAAGYRSTAQGVSASRTEILTSLLTAMEQERFAIDRQCRERATLFNELLTLRMKGKPGNPNAIEGYDGQDDVAFALALAIWWGIK